jgi:uncharacterized protein (TIGR03067 family)
MGTVLLGLALVAGAPALKEKDKAPSLVGVWEVESITTNGKQNAATTGLRYTFTEDGKWLIHRNGKETSPGISRGVTVDPKPNPPTVDLVSNTKVANGSRLLGIYKVEGDTLTICGTRVIGVERPKKFDAPAGSSITMYVLKRVTKE